MIKHSPKNSQHANVPRQFYENRCLYPNQKETRPISLTQPEKGPQTFISAAVSRVDWDRTPYKGLVCQTEESLTHLHVNLPEWEPHKVLSFFEVATGVDTSTLFGNELQLATKHLTEDEPFSKDNLNRHTDPVIDFGYSQTDVFCKIDALYSINERVAHHIVSHFKKILRVGANTGYYGEDALLVLCAAIEGLAKYIIEKPNYSISGKSIKRNDISGILAGRSTMSGFPNKWQTARNSLAHGMFYDRGGRKIHGYEYVHETIPIFFEAAAIMFCLCIDKAETGVVVKSIYHQNKVIL